MGLLQIFTGEVIAIEAFQPEVGVPDNLELPDGYAMIDDGATLAGNKASYRLVTAKMGRARHVQFVCDATLLDLSVGVIPEVSDGEGKDKDSDVEIVTIPPTTIKIAYDAAKITGIANMEKGVYAYFQDPLEEKFVQPKVNLGIKSAISTIVAAYILFLMAKQIHLDFFVYAIIVIAGICIFACVAQIIFALSSAKEVHQKMRLYFKKLA